MIYIFNNQYDLEHETLNLFCATHSVIRVIFSRLFFKNFGFFMNIQSLELFSIKTTS